MAFKDFFAKLKYLDNKMARWTMRHFYVMFFQIALILMFIAFLLNFFEAFTLRLMIDKTTVAEQFLNIQTMFMAIIVILVLLNSFWMLYMYNLLIRIRVTLKDIDYHLSKRRDR